MRPAKRGEEESSNRTKRARSASATERASDPERGKRARLHSDTPNPANICARSRLLGTQVVQLGLNGPFGRIPEFLVDVDVDVFDDLAGGGIAAEVP